MMGSNELTISYRGGDDVFRIKLKQEGRLIEPTELIKPARRGRDPKEHAVFFVANFPYSEIDLNAKTTVIVIKDFGTDKYNVDFSKIK